MTRQATRREFLQATGVTAASGVLATNAHSTTSSYNAVTPESDLYDTGMVNVSTSRWYRGDSERRQYPRLTQDIDTDLLVVGGGLAGTSLCLHLAEAGVNTTLIEARQPGWGASGRNAGHVLPYIRDIERLKSFPGEGKPFLDFFCENKHLPFSIAEKYNIDCDAARVGLLDAISSKSVFDKRKAYAESWQARYGHNVSSYAGSEMRDGTGTERYEFGVLWEDGGRFNPYLLSRGMASAAEEKGAHIFGDTPARKIEKHGERWRVQSESGSIIAKKVVVCTNAYTPDFLPELGKSYSPVIPYTLSTKPIPEELRKLIMPMGATMEQYPIDSHPFLIDGSGRMITSLLPRYFNPEDGQAHFGDLLRWVHKTWPESTNFDIELEDYTTGRTAWSQDGFAKIYQLEPELLALTNFSGWGNLMAPLLGKHLAQVLATEQLDQLAVPLTPPEEVMFPGWMDFMLRGMVIPMGRLAERLSII